MMEGSRKRKRRQKPKPKPKPPVQILLSLPVANAPTHPPQPPPLHTTTNNGTKLAVSFIKTESSCSVVKPCRRRQKRKQESQPQSESPAEPCRCGKRRQALRPQSETPSEPGCRDLKREQEAAPVQDHEQKPETKKRLKVVRIHVTDPDATESSKDEEDKPAVDRKRRKVEIVHEIRILKENPRPCLEKNPSFSPRKDDQTKKKSETQKTGTIKETRKKNLVGDIINKEVELGGGSDQVKGSSSSSSSSSPPLAASMGGKKMVLYDLPGPIPRNLDKIMEEGEEKGWLFSFFDGMRSDCSETEDDEGLKL